MRLGLPSVLRRLLDFTFQLSRRAPRTNGNDAGAAFGIQVCQVTTQALRCTRDEDALAIEISRRRVDEGLGVVEHIWFDKLDARSARIRSPNFLNIFRFVLKAISGLLSHYEKRILFDE